LERITSIGGNLPDGKSWTLKLYDAIKAIEDKTYEFYVTVDDETINVEIAEREGRKYLKTKPDKTKKDNLLSLPSCSLWG